MEKATKTHTLLILLRIILFVYIGKMLLWGYLGNNIIRGIYDWVVHEYLRGLLFGISSLCALAALIAMVVLTFKLTPAKYNAFSYTFVAYILFYYVVPRLLNIIDTISNDYPLTFKDDGALIFELAFALLIFLYPRLNMKKIVFSILAIISAGIYFVWLYYPEQLDNNMFLINQLFIVLETWIVIPILFALLKGTGEIVPKKKEPVKSIESDYAFEHRSVALSLFLSVITCGIYYLYWFVKLVKQVKEFHGDSSSCTGEVCLNLFVPFYAYYWLYTRNSQLSVDAYRRGEVMKDSSVSCLVFAIFGMPVISFAIMQNNMNHYMDKKQINKLMKSSVTKEVSSASAKTKLSELQDLLTSGLITQEDYDEKKKQILQNLL